MPTILITDSLFIFKEHEQKLIDAGFEIERLDKPEATEAELIAAIKGKVGYLLGGIEHVTEPVINAATDLKAIVFTGTDWADFIPAHDLATKKGTLIANSPGANTNSVAEYTIMLILMMLRRALELGPTGDKTFMTTLGLSDTRVGIVGLGRIGQKVARMLKAIGATDVCYWDRNQKTELATEIGITYLTLEEMFKTADIITSHLSSQAGELITGTLLERTKQGVLLINTGAKNSFNLDMLYKLLSSDKARAAFDADISDKRFVDLPLSNWFKTNVHTGYNTIAANKLASDMATESIINMLTKGNDQYVVNNNN